MSKHRIAALALGLAAASTTSADQPFFLPLGDLPGGRFSSQATGMSADGSVIVGVARTPQGEQAFHWTAATGMVGLGDLPGGFFRSEAVGVSADGTVVVGTGLSAAGHEAFRWTQASGMIGLGTVPGGTGHSLATAVSADGLVIAGRSGASIGPFLWTAPTGMQLYSYPYELLGLSADGSFRLGKTANQVGAEAFVESTNGGVQLLGDLPGGQRYSGAIACSADARVFVGWGTAEGFYAWPIRWTAETGMQPLAQRNGVAVAVSADGTTIVGTFYDTSTAFRWTALDGAVEIPELSSACAVSADGSVIAGTAYDPVVFEQAVRWSIIDGVQSLGDIPGERIDSSATAISADGSTVVGWSASDNGYEAFRWTADTGMHAFGFLPGGANSSEATAVSADGSVVVGISAVANEYEAFRYTPVDGMQPLHHPGSGSAAYGVSVDGAVVVGAVDDAAFRWSQAGGEFLGDLPGIGGGPAVAVSADGATVIGNAAGGYYDNPLNAPFRWTQAEGVVGIPDPNSPTGYVNGSASGVSADGSVIVGFNGDCFSDIDGNWVCLGEAFRWSTESGFEQLTSEFDDEYTCFATGVSADGSVVVGNCRNCGRRCVDDPFIWDRAHGVRRLKPLLVSLGVTEAETWALTANGISADGRTIVGSGIGGTPIGRQGWIAHLHWSGDVDDDLDVDLADLALLLSAFSSCDGDAIFLHAADVDSNGCVELADLAVLLSHFGA